MTTALAFIHARRARTDDNVHPVVFIDGAPEPALRVRRFIRQGPMDTCAVELGVIAMSSDMLSPLERWIGHVAVVAAPLRLDDSQIRWHVLAHGLIATRAASSGSGGAVDATRLVVVDDWTHRLRVVPRALMALPDGELAPVSGHARLMIGHSANRSLYRHVVADASVHVLSDIGLRWSIGDAIATLLAFASLDVNASMLPHDVASLPLTEAIDLAAPVGVSLARLLDLHGLVIHRERTLSQGVVTERRRVMPAGYTAVPVDQSSIIVDTDTRAANSAAPGAARAIVVRASGPLVESTFALGPGWPAALEGMSDDAYSPRTNSNFTAVSDVYRHWVLNEDGRFTAPPYERGPAFDLPALFEQSSVPAQTLRFLPCLTLDASGVARPPILEVSTDEGDTWAWFPGLWELDTTRAAVRLMDVDLPASFLDAAQSGMARVRITASLQSPQPIETRRWIGDPQRGSAPPLLIDAGPALADARVHSQSIHISQVTSGTLTARQNDASADARALAVWRARRAMTPSNHARRLILRGLWFALRPGDRVSVRDGRARVRITPGPTDGVIQSLRCTWPVEGNHPRRAGVTRLSIIS